MTEDEETPIRGPIGPWSYVSCMPRYNDTGVNCLWSWVNDGVESVDNWVGNAVQEAEAVKMFVKRLGLSRNNSLLMCGLISWSNITSKGDDLLDGCVWRVHAEDMIDLMLLLPNRLMAIP